MKEREGAFRLHPGGCLALPYRLDVLKGRTFIADGERDED